MKCFFLFTILLSLFVLSQSSPHSSSKEDFFSVLSVEKLNYVLNSVNDDDRRETAILELLELLFSSVEELEEQFPQYAVKGNDEFSKHSILNEFVNEFISKQERELYLKKSERDLSSSAVANPKCVSCRAIKTLVEIMCNQNYTIQSGTCVMCSSLTKMANFICTFNCTVSTMTTTMHNPTGGPSLTQNVSCVPCASYFLSIQFFCGLPNCTTGDPYSYVYNADLPYTDHVLSTRSLATSRAVPFSCIPCYYQWVAYELLCGDIWTHCANGGVIPPPPPPPPASSVTPSSSPPPVLPSASPSPSNYYYYYYEEEEKQ